mmetsp:Transcript_15762/g.54745  ORF Transcript_15762/g.54745 Transcript_15762/m.54745 type:complete len:245 (+) Transcript_15762:1289-2023(+)
MASTSSMKMMQGACSRAASNSLRTRLAPRPTSISSNSDADRAKKGTPASPATARASSVLPVPGGPYSSTPLGALMPTRTNSSGFVNGNSTTSRSSRICSFSPPTAENDTLPGSSLSMLNTMGSTSRGSTRMMVSVVMSRATRVPALSSATSTFVRNPTTHRGPDAVLTMKRSSSSCFSTSPIICPTLCIAFRSASVFSNSVRSATTDSSLAFILACISRCSTILRRSCWIATARSSAMAAGWDQ